MLAYGCPRVMFKMDKNGEGQEICMAELSQCRNPSFVGFSPDMFLEVRTMQPVARQGFLCFRRSSKVRVTHATVFCFC